METDDDRYTRITLRIPKDLHARVSAAADAASRSTNAEIVGRLATTFEGAAPRHDSAATPPEAELLRTSLHRMDGVVQLLARSYVDLYNATSAADRPASSDINFRFARWLVRSTPNVDQAVASHAGASAESIWNELIEYKQRTGQQMFAERATGAPKKKAR